MVVGNFSIGEAWSQALAFLKTHMQMLLIVAGGGAVLAAILQYLGTGGEQLAQSQGMMGALARGDFAKFRELTAAGNAANSALGGAYFLTVIGAAIVTSGTEMAAFRLGLLGEEEGVGQSIGYGIIATILSFLVFMLVGIVAVLVIAIPLGLLGAGAAFATAGAGGGTGGLASVGIIMLLLILILIPLSLWISARLSVWRPAMAAARSVNPFFGIAQSWRLTRGSAWPIVGYLLLLIIAAIVIGVLAAGIVGVIGGLAGAFGALVLTTILITVPFTLLQISVTAGIYNTLVPVDSGDIFA